jgi:hypothetical protein
MSRQKRVKVNPIEMRGSIDRFLPKGIFSVMLGDADGKPLWKKPRIASNLVVADGRSWILKHIMSSESANVSSQIITAIAIGSGTTAPASSDHLLGSELVRVAYTTETDNSATNAGINAVWAASYNSTQGNGTLSEAGAFNTTSANASTMLCHVTFTTFAKTTSNTLKMWGRSIVRWMREFLLIDSNAEIANEGQVLCTA